MKQTPWLVVAFLAACGGAIGKEDPVGGLEDAGALPDTGAPEGGGPPSGSCSPDAGTVPAGDGCNTCTCVGGKWGCTLIGCPPKECTPGQTKSIECSTCKCTAQSTWECAWVPCVDAGPPSNAACGARAGNTCRAYEYCAYQPNQLCGGGDIESRCKLRPTACDLQEAPVCGCNRKVYSNECLAAMAGTGVLNKGQCP